MDELFIGAIQSPTAESLCSELPNWQIENGKAAFLDYLYRLYDRDNVPNGLRGTYTGLWEQFQHDVAQIHRASFISAIASTYTNPS